MREALSICFPFVAFQFIGYLCPWMMKRAIPHPKLPSLDSSLYIATITSFSFISPCSEWIFSCESIMLSLRVQEPFLLSRLWQSHPWLQCSHLSPPLRITHLPLLLSQGGAHLSISHHFISLQELLWMWISVRTNLTWLWTSQGSPLGIWCQSFSFVRPEADPWEWEGAGAAP